LLLGISLLQVTRGTRFGAFSRSSGILLYKTRNEVLGARVGIYMAAKKWDMAAAVASHLVKVEPENAGWWITLAYSVRRTEGIEKAEAILLRAKAIHPKVAMLASPAAWRRQKSDCDTPSNLTKRLGNWRSKMKI
jgi:hypothetical protein